MLRSATGQNLVIFTGLRAAIMGRLPIDTLKRARNALARAAQMKKSGHISEAVSQKSLTTGSLKTARSI